MSEQKLIDLGAECVTGDLILNQKTVGRYRNGAFLITEAGLLLLQNIVEAEAGGVEVIEPSKAPRATKAPTVPKARTKKDQTAEVEPPVEPPVETMAGLNLEDLDAVLGT